MNRRNPENGGLLLAVDGGGSKTRVFLGDQGGGILLQKDAASANPLYVSPAAFKDKLQPMLAAAAREAAERGQTVEGAALAGPMDKRLAARIIARVFGRIPVYEASEGEAALACHGLDSGIAVIAGTGSSAFHVDISGASHGRGGYGPQFGDEGSGYWIGREALAAAARDEDGRGPETGLTPRILEHFGAATLWDVHRLCAQTGHLHAPAMAALAPLVTAAAESGDPIAREILREAGRMLAGLALAAAQQGLPHPPPIPVAPSGGVFHAGALILEPLEQTLREAGLPYFLCPTVTEPGPGLLRYLLMRSESQQTPKHP